MSVWGHEETVGDVVSDVSCRMDSGLDAAWSRPPSYSQPRPFVGTAGAIDGSVGPGFRLGGKARPIVPVLGKPGFVDFEGIKIVISVDQFDVIEHPTPIEGSRRRPVETEVEEELAAFGSGNPVGLFSLRGLGAEVDIDASVVIGCDSLG